MNTVYVVFKSEGQFDSYYRSVHVVCTSKEKAEEVCNERNAFYASFKQIHNEVSAEVWKIQLSFRHMDEEFRTDDSVINQKRAAIKALYTARGIPEEYLSPWGTPKEDVESVSFDYDETELI